MISRQHILRTLLIVTLIGLALSVYSWLHNLGLASGEFCAIDETFNCDIVNKGPYGRFMGVPVSLIGVIGYGILVIGVFVKKRRPDDHELTRFLLLASIAGLLFSFYLTGVEAFILHAWCLVCLTSQFVILISTYLLYRLFQLERL
jgi:uncharacterized membrane protein